MAHLTLLLVLLWVGTTVSTVVDVDKRIIGGQQCGQNERRYHVKLVDINNNFICGGSLINDQWILTVAHCWEPGLSVVLGVHPGPGVTVRITTEPKIYEKKHLLGKKIHDIMLLKLPAGTQIPAGVQPIELGDCDVKPGLTDQLQIAGHASTRMYPNKTRICGQSPTLQCANVNVVHCSWFKKILAKIRSTPQHWFCGKAPGVDACPGDSGGGVVYNNWLYGLISRGGIKATEQSIDFINLCHPDYLQWIQTTAVP